MVDEWFNNPEIGKKFSEKTEQQLHQELLTGSPREKAAAQAELRRREQERQDSALRATTDIARWSMYAAIASAVSAIALAIITASQVFWTQP